MLQAEHCFWQGDQQASILPCCKLTRIIHMLSTCCGCCCCTTRSIKLWSFYADLEESLGTLESASAVYDRLLELRLATPQIILNYALMLQARLGKRFAAVLACCAWLFGRLSLPACSIPWVQGCTVISYFSYFSELRLGALAHQAVKGRPDRPGTQGMLMLPCHYPAA
jgi:hypothetical protein